MYYIYKCAFRSCVYIGALSHLISSHLLLKHALPTMQHLGTNTVAAKYKPAASMFVCVC